MPLNSKHLVGGFRSPLLVALALVFAAPVAADDIPAVQQRELEVQLTEAKAQIAEYEKLVDELMKKQIPAIQSTLDGLSKPLVVGECAGAMTLADGRSFENVIVSAITPTSITIRSGREIVSIPWRKLPVYFKVRAAHSVVAAANTATAIPPAATVPPPPPPAVEPAVPEGDNIYIGPIALRIVEGGGEDYTYYAWTAKVGNPTEYGATRRPDITFFDRDGFKIEDALGEKEYIPPKSFRILTGKSLMKTVLWKQIEKYEVVLK